MTVPIDALYDHLKKGSRDAHRRMVDANDIETRRYFEGVGAAYEDVRQHFQPDLIEAVRAATVANVAAELRKLAENESEPGHVQAALQFAAATVEKM